MRSKRQYEAYKWILACMPIRDISLFPRVIKPIGTFIFESTACSCVEDALDMFLHIQWCFF